MSTAAKQINRLSDFIIEEVSLVDRAANKRRFLTVKRDDTDGREHLATLEPDGRGGFRIVANDTDTEDNGDTTMTIPANVTKGMEAIEQIFYKVGDAVDRLMRVASVCMQAESLKVDGPTMETVAAEIDKVTQALNDVKAELGVAKSLLKGADDNDADAAAATDKGKELDSTIASLEAMAAELKKTAEAKVAKAGAAMSAGRLKRYQSALKELLSVLREVGGDVKSVMPDDEAKGSKGKAKKADEAPAPAQPTAAKTQDQPEAGKPADEPAALAKREAEAAELAKLRKENAVLKASPVPSQAIPVEGGDTNPTADDFDWPMDMNKPLGRDHVPAEKSFHG